MILNYKTINNIQLPKGVELSFEKNAGEEHYKLLCYLAAQINNATILDIGTHNGWSAIALGSNPTNKVFTFDLVDKISPEEKNNLWLHKNVTFEKINIMDNLIREQRKEFILSSSLIFLDIDPHDGVDEYDFYCWLAKNDFNGLLVCDDIWYFKGMRDNFWFKIPSDIKYDVTSVGHFSGTGIITFSKSRKIEIVGNEKFPPRLPKTNSNNGYTVVTAYFNLTKTPDASKEIKEKNMEYYLKHANMTMSMEQNLVVFCDPESEPLLKKLRPDYLKEKTHYIVIEFMDLDIVKNNYSKLFESRKRTGYLTDPRNTVSYYLFCMSRYEMLERTMKLNPFNSTHFAWCNICIERMSWKSGLTFPLIWQEFRDKFSTCYIDYQPKRLVLDNVQEYYKYGGRCSMCSGFFTGNKYYMEKFCTEIKKEFLEMLSLDVGHADEQLFSRVYFKNPDIFEFYLGDYSEMIVNYGWVIDRPFEPVKNVIKNLYNSGEDSNNLLYTLCNRWLESYELGCFTIDLNVIHFVKSILRLATLKKKTFF